MPTAAKRVNGGAKGESPAWLKQAWVGLLAATLPLFAGASGSDVSEDQFVNRFGTDVPDERYQAGDLGVLLPSYHRVYLYPAWRAIVLGREGLAKSPGSPGGQERAVGRAVSGWVSLSQREHPYNQWMLVRRAVVGDNGETGDARRQGFASTGWGGHVNCPETAFSFAAETLQRMGERREVKRERLAEWVQAQDQVFAYCEFDAEAAKQQGRAAPPIPAELTSGDTYWRQLRDYQIAAAHFYAGHHAEAARRFTTIGATANHPMRAWGAYLALRANVRQATLGEPGSGQPAPVLPPTEDREAEATALAQQAQKILNDPSLVAVHAATRATVRTVQFRLTPRHRFADLGQQLDDPAADPYREDQLGDWRRLATQLMEDAGDEAIDSTDHEWRPRHEYFDWMRTLQRCALGEDAALRPARCREERAHAEQRWQALAKTPGKTPGKAPAKGSTAAPASDAEQPYAAGRRRAWFVAMMMLADTLPAPLEKAALAVPASAPEYTTVRYHLSRLYLKTGRPAQARELSQQMLSALKAAQPSTAIPIATKPATVPTVTKPAPAKPATPPTALATSTVNLFKAIRFSTATSVADASNGLMRNLSYSRQPDAGEAGPLEPVPSGAMLSDDGRWWLNTRLAVTDLTTLARDGRLPLRVRQELAIAAWMRAGLLGQAQADGASYLAAELAPAVEAAARAYRAADTPARKRHVLLVHAMQLGLSPLIVDRGALDKRWDQQAPPADKTDVAANMWCSVAKNATGDRFENGRAPEFPLPNVSSDTAVRDKEWALLAKLKSATGVVGADVLAWAKDNPDDPDVPWLLHVVVQSTRAGCLDPDSKQVSKAAYTLLHKRYKNSEWAANTPYWY